MLRTKFYSGLSRSQLRSALRHRFDGGESYAKLLVAARVAELEVSSVGSNQVGVESMLNDKLDKVLEEMSSIRKRVERLEVGKLRRVAGSGQAASRGVEVQALLDTGSMVSTISEALVSQLGLQAEPVESLLRVQCAGGGEKLSAGAWVMARECLQLHQQVMVTDGLGKVVTGTREVK
ncbi:hypothetical protein CAPTEDRAFT_209157, partial [Capitella teleta]